MLLLLLMPLRSIPACAGEPPTTHSSHCKQWVYPRVCGGALLRSHYEAHWQGLSPRVRGSLSLPYWADYQYRSIPACAGEPFVVFRFGESTKVYPRVCGGAPAPGMASSKESGLSPRVRGSPVGAGKPVCILRSIPACAGEPSSYSAILSMITVYPRVCGGASSPVYRSARGSGLSPRVRGSPSPRPPASS